jgi:hypothetical protein
MKKKKGVLSRKLLLYVPLWANQNSQGNTLNQMIYNPIEFVPGIYKRIIVNAADNKVRDRRMNTIKVTIDRDSSWLLHHFHHTIAVLYLPRRDYICRIRDSLSSIVTETRYIHFFTSN